MAKSAGREGMDYTQLLREREEYRNVPLEALRETSRRKLGLYMDLECDIVVENNVPNYIGLAELAGFTYLEIKKFERTGKPTEALLDHWTTSRRRRPTFGTLYDYLKKLDRIDAITDCCKLFVPDAEAYMEMKRIQDEENRPIQDGTVSSEMDIDEKCVPLTTDDVSENQAVYFDAFVSYHPEGADLQFVKEMIKVLESPPHNLKLFVPHRNDLPGGSKHTLDARIIEERCKKMVMIMTPEYQKSSACDFQYKFAHSLSPGARSKKLIPVILRQCEIPQILRHVTVCDYTKRDLMEWFWERLARAIGAKIKLGACDVRSDGDNLTLELPEEQEISF